MQDFLFSIVIFSRFNSKSRVLKNKKSVIIAFRFVIRAAFLCTSEGGGERKKDRGKRSPLSGVVCSHLWLVCNGRVGDVAATKNILFSLS